MIVTPQYVQASGYNSASGGWYWINHATFENYCPYCGRHGGLTFNPKGTPEGEFTCKFCDSDFSISGKCKSGYRNAKSLTKFVVVKKLNTSSPMPVVNMQSGYGLSPVMLLKSKLSIRFCLF